MELVSTNETNKEVTLRLNGKTAVVPAYWIRPGDFDGKYDRIHINGLAVRYPTGGKVWCGSITYWLHGKNFSAPSTPLDHHVRRANVSVVGFYEDVDPKYRSAR